MNGPSLARPRNLHVRRLAMLEASIALAAKRVPGPTAERAKTAVRVARAAYDSLARGDTPLVGYEPALDGAAELLEELRACARRVA